MSTANPEYCSHCHTELGATRIFVPGFGRFHPECVIQQPPEVGPIIDQILFPPAPSPLPQPEGQTPRTDAAWEHAKRRLLNIVVHTSTAQQWSNVALEMLDHARTLERELGEVRAAQWRPIETADNDASVHRIIGIEHNREPSVYRKVWDGTWREANDPMGSPRCWPILWQPLPTPPSA